MRRFGDMAQFDFYSMRLAEQLQTLAMQYIHEAFFAEEDLAIDNLTWNRFSKAMDDAQQEGPVAKVELDRQLAKILKGVLPQVLNPQPPGQGQGQQPGQAQPSGGQ